MDKKQSGKTKATLSGMLANHLPIEGQGRDEMKRFYAWGFEDAWKAQEEWKSKNQIAGSYQKGPFFRWVAAQELKQLYEACRAGDSAAVIEALYLCSLNSLPIPRWCEFEFLAAYRKVRQYKAASWDDVFGKPHPKGTHLKAKRELWEKGSQVYYRIEEILRNEPETPIDGSLFERVGREFAIGAKTKTEMIYYGQKKRHKTLEQTFNNPTKI